MKLLLLFSLLQAQPPSGITITHGDKSASVPVLLTQRGPMVRLEPVLGALGAVLLRRSPDAYRLVLGSTELDLTIGLAVARHKDAAVQLGAAPHRF